MDISIIIPVYNAERYLDRCIKSVLAQDIDLEVILINDGSTDNSLEICVGYKKDKRVSVYSFSENRGQSAARNCGIRKAKGEYILFVDSDDYIETDVLSSLLEICKNKNLDVLTFDYDTVSQSGEWLSSPKHVQIAPDEVMKGTDIIEQNWKGLEVPPFLYLMRTGFIKSNHLHFVEGHYHEDCIWRVDWLPKAERVSYAPELIYHYVLSDNSTMRSVNLKRYKDLVFASERVHRIAELYRSQYSDKVAEKTHEYGSYLAWAAIHAAVQNGYRIRELEVGNKKLSRLLKGNVRYFTIFSLTLLRMDFLTESFVNILDKVRMKK